MLVWPGQRLLGRRRDSADHRQVQNGCVYRIVSVDAAQVVVCLDIDHAPPIRMTHQEALQHMRLNCARTYAGIQGLTLHDQRLLLCDVGHRHMDLRKMYVPCSIVTPGGLLHVSSL